MIEFIFHLFNYYKISDSTNERLSYIEGYKGCHIDFLGTNYIKKSFGLKHRKKSDYELIKESISRIEKMYQEHSKDINL